MYHIAAESSTIEHKNTYLPISQSKTTLYDRSSNSNKNSFPHKPSSVSFNYLCKSHPKSLWLFCYRNEVFIRSQFT